ncbi:hypothetical protein RFI_12877 [Reticulomyxa filosa]|uniref:Uncharacterized protein n=1 Tax=Reticulomyxa filosa TaxID=46433 RepID=X6NG15_RETFI|nr:hypothetical protein RFI_12877 [Reticulomyxa filosa]|eukprot:ETO24282.1 hypothetical protein RFI_12877 [Reticulomyxa filosa]
MSHFVFVTYVLSMRSIKCISTEKNKGRRLFCLFLEFANLVAEQIFFVKQIRCISMTESKTENEKPLNFDETSGKSSCLAPQPKAGPNYPLQLYVAISYHIIIIFLQYGISGTFFNFFFFFLLLKKTNVLQQRIVYKNKKDERLTTFNIKDEKWNKLDLRNGDEILCTYSSNSDQISKVDKIEFPALYQSEIIEDDDAQFALVILHCKKSQETKVNLVNDDRKKGKWKARDKVEFRCRYRGDAWIAVGVNIIQQAPLFSSLLLLFFF